MKTEVRPVMEIKRDEDRTVFIVMRGTEAYTVIGDVDGDSIDVGIGDAIEYELYGINFGWFIKAVK